MFNKSIFSKKMIPQYERMVGNISTREMEVITGRIFCKIIEIEQIRDDRSREAMTLNK